MSELRELYQEVILDHNKRPRNYGGVAELPHHSEGYNPLCGDRVSVGVNLDHGVIADVRFEGSGCAISQASASTMTEAVKGKGVEEARTICGEFQDMVTTNSEAVNHLDESLMAFEGVREFPIRIKCATLPWHTLLAALSEGEE